jgi:serine phosphatase RsbU (regulator of sigma subunit)
MKSGIKHILLVLAITFCFIGLNGQQNNIDSLRILLQNAKDDTTRISIYHEILDLCEIDDNLVFAQALMEIADKHIDQTKNQQEKRFFLLKKAIAYTYIEAYYQEKGDVKSDIEYVQKRIATYIEANDTAKIVNSYLYLAQRFNDIGVFSKALEFNQKAQLVSKESNFKEGIGSSLNQLGTMYLSQRDTTQALLNYRMSLMLAIELKDSSEIARNLNNMGGAYASLKIIEQALNYYYQSISLYKAMNNQSGICFVYFNIGRAYEQCDDFSNALKYYQLSLSLAEEINDVESILRSIRFIGKAYSYKNQNPKAIEYHQRALSMYQKMGRDYEAGWCYGDLATDYANRKDFANAKRFVLLYLSRMKTQPYLENIKQAEGETYEIFSAAGDFKEALEHYKNYVEICDKLNSEEIRKAATKDKFQSDYEKQRELDKFKQYKKDALRIIEKRKQNIIILLVVSGLLIVSLFAGFILRSLKITRRQKIVIEIKSEETELQKKIIEAKNKDITDSITYAKRIQQAKLPAIDDIYKSLTDSFVLFKPKDIVSGDFYYFHRKNNTIYIAAADCTGHGVPGAFMSLIGFERLDDALALYDDPAEILSHLNKGIKKSLHQSDSEESTRDGMDIAFCTFNIENSVLKFAGANRPLWVHRQDQSDFEEIKATKKAIGGLTDSNQIFETHELQLNSGDSFYMFSDGYADSFGRLNGKKLTTKKFREFLHEIQQKPMQEQSKLLDDFIENWMSGTEQVDDILVIGVRIT